jgi:hypothetical protein
VDEENDVMMRGAIEGKKKQKKRRCAAKKRNCPDMFRKRGNIYTCTVHE